jgi:ribonuclease Z
VILHVLGAGTPTPTPERYGTSFVLQLGEEYLMFDCGPATTHKLVKMGIFPTQIGNLFFTHHHYDHNVDYPCFLLCRWDQSTGSESQLRVWGPPPTNWITERFIGSGGVFFHDLKSRMEHPASRRVHVHRGGSLPRPQPVVDATDIGPEEVIENDHWQVTTARARHFEPWLESLAYRVESERGTVVFAGDTGFCESVSRLAQKADVLVVSCFEDQDWMAKHAKEDAEIIMGTRDVARMAYDCEVKTLVISHYSTRIAGPDSMAHAVRDITQTYPGEVVFAEELTSFAVS